MNGGGRKQDPVWNKFTREKVGTGFKAKCKKCDHIQQGLVERMKAHVRVCYAEAEEEEHDIIEVEIGQAAACSSVPKPVKSSVSASPKATQPTKRQRTMDKYVVSTTPTEKKEFDKLVAEFFFATNTPFNHAEHSTFKKLIQKLHPGTLLNIYYIILLSF